MAAKMESKIATAIYKTNDISDSEEDMKSTLMSLNRVRGQRIQVCIF